MPHCASQRYFTVNIWTDLGLAKHFVDQVRIFLARGSLWHHFAFTMVWPPPFKKHQSLSDVWFSVTQNYPHNVRRLWSSFKSWVIQPCHCIHKCCQQWVHQRFEWFNITALSVLKGILYVVWSKYRFAVLLWFCMMEIHQIKLLYSFGAFEKDFGCNTPV